MSVHIRAPPGPDPNSVRSVKFNLSPRHRVLLHAHKIVRGGTIASIIERALDEYFAERSARRAAA